MTVNISYTPQDEKLMRAATVKMRVECDYVYTMAPELAEEFADAEFLPAEGTIKLERMEEEG